MSPDHREAVEQLLELETENTLLRQQLAEARDLIDKFAAINMTLTGQMVKLVNLDPFYRKNFQDVCPVDSLKFCLPSQQATGAL